MTTTAGLVIQLWFYIFPVKKAQEMPPPPPPPPSPYPHGIKSLTEKSLVLIKHYEDKKIKLTASFEASFNKVRAMNQIHQY